MPTNGQRRSHPEQRKPKDRRREIIREWKLRCDDLTGQPELMKRR